jgi:hypothetical protein
MTLPIITDPQKVLSAVTYFRRGTLQSLLSLQAVDDDGSIATIAVATKPKLENSRFEAAVASINAGKYTKEQLVSQYDLTELQLKALEV